MTLSARMLFSSHEITEAIDRFYQITASLPLEYAAVREHHLSLTIEKP